MCNPRSINNKFEELELSAQNNNADIVAISKTWFNTDTPLEQYAIPGFLTFSRPRTETTGGGVAVYARHNLQPRILNVDTPNNVESIWVHMRPPRLPRSVSCVIIGTVYYP